MIALIKDAKGDMSMTCKSIAVVILLAFLIPGSAAAGAVSEKDFMAETTRDLLNLCSASPDDPLYHQAINFCHGYLIGAYHYYQAMTAGPKGIKFVCMPDPEPSRNEEIGRFIDWARSHPEYFDESPVETEFRYLMQRFPCR